MLESGLSGSVRGVPSNGHPYRDPGPKSVVATLFWNVRKLGEAAIGAGDGTDRSPKADLGLRARTSLSFRASLNSRAHRFSQFWGRSTRKIAVQDIEDWLEKLGMSEYAQRFAENDIDFSVLGDLTDQDLKDLGVSSLGHRRKILRAIAELGSTTAASTAVPARTRRHAPTCAERWAAAGRSSG